MSEIGPQPSSPEDRPARIVLVALLSVLALFPPETRGHSMLGCSVLIAVLSLLSAPRLAGRHGPAWLLAGGLAIVPWAWTSVAPGAAVEPVTIALLAAACGIAVSALAPATRTGGAVPWTLAVTAGAVAVWGIYQKVSGLDATAGALQAHPLLPDQQAVLARLREGRAFAAFATPASMGAFLAMALPVTLCLARARAGVGRYSLLALAGLQAAGLVAAASATALAALLGAVVLFGLVRGGRRVALVASALVLAAIAMVVAIRGIRVLDPRAEEGPWRLRAANFRLAGEIWADHPWLGVGPGGYGEVYPLHRRPGDNESRHVHNLPLELAADTGTAGALLLGGLFFGAFLGPLAGRRRLEGWQGGAAVGLGAFALHNLADFTAFLPSTLWLAAALRGALTDVADLPPRGVPVRATARLCTAAALTLVIAAAGVGALAGLAREKRFEVVLAAAAGDPAVAAGGSAAAARLAPWNVEGWLLDAQVLLDRAAADDEARSLALESAGRAVRLSPVRPVARAVRARARALNGDLPGAYADLYEAARLYPMQERYARERDGVAERLVAGGGPR